MSTTSFTRGALTVAAALLTGCGGGPASQPSDCAKASGSICTVAGNGTAGDGADDLPARETKLYLPQDMTVGPDGRLFIVDWNNHRIRALQPDGTLHIVAGEGELGLSSDDPATDRLNHPTNVAFDPQGNLVIAAWHNSRIKTVDLATGDITDVCGNGMRAFNGDGGPAPAAALNLPVAVVFNAAGDLIIADQANDRLRLVDHATGNIGTMAGIGPCAAGTPCELGDGGPAAAASFSFPAGQAAQPGGRIDIDGAGNIYVADTSNARVRKIDGDGVITTVAGTGQIGYAGDDGPATLALVSRVSDVAAAPDGSVYIADTGNSCVRVIRGDGTIGTAAGHCGSPGFAGDDGPATDARLDRPTGVAVDRDGNLYIADAHNQRVRVVYR
jgi:hypothetical protein